uniref:Receptor L-domain domain-containing protein n=1 Tax=Panagrellus redivivus TaxID=6233 RepID=A0A7E4UQF5_PANRE
MTTTRETQTCLVLLLFIAIVGISKAMDPAAAVNKNRNPTPEGLQSKLRDDNLACNVTLTNTHQITRLTDHSTYETWRPREYEERIFRGVESLQTLILMNMNINSLTKFDLFDLPNLKYIAPDSLRPDGFFNDIGNVGEMVRQSRNHSLHPQTQDGIDPLAVNREDPNMLQTKLNRKRLNCTITRPNHAQIDIWCFKMTFNRLPDLFNLVQYNNIRNLKIEKPSAMGTPPFPVVSPIRCLQGLYLEKMPNLNKLPLFGYLPTLKVLGLADVNVGHLTDHSVNATLQPALSLTRIFQGVGLSLQKIVIYRTHIQQITPFDLIDLPNLREIEPEQLRPAGFVNGQGAGKEIRGQINGLGFPVPVRPIGFVAPRTNAPPHSIVRPHRVHGRVQKAKKT